MKNHQNSLLFIGLLCAALSGGCAVDERTGKALADALCEGPVRDYASAQARSFAETSLVLKDQAAPTSGSPQDLSGAQASWFKARAAYDRGVAVFAALLPELDFKLDGRFDDPLAKSGLRFVERALFGAPPAPGAELLELTADLRDGALSLQALVPDPVRPLPAAVLLGSMSAVAATVAGKLDGMSSPYAGASLLSVQENLVGLQAMYAVLSPLVQGADSELDEQISALLQELLAQLAGQVSLEALTDKPRFLRTCAALSLSFKKVGTALGLAVTTVDLS
jgi:iron uptake system EfeUOB component EfeO/EfeM